MTAGESWCDDCAAAERPPVTISRRIGALGIGILCLILPRPPPYAQMFAGQSALMHAMIGAGYGQQTAYDRHRDDWIQRGDLADLHRMLRHVRAA